MTKNIRFLGTLLLLSTFTVACSPPSTMYRWDAYESLTYAMYFEPGDAEPEVQIIKLNEEIEKTHAQGIRVPPGLHAHLSYMHFLKGDKGEAAKELILEKQLFPESTVFVDGMLERMNQ